MRKINIKLLLKSFAVIAAIILAAGFSNKLIMVRAANESTTTDESISNGASYEVKEISSAKQLLEAAKSEMGSYRLTSDIDMSGIKWTPWDFKGTFDGDGHSILNLTVTEAGGKTTVTYDGNRNPYDTYGAGFFGVLDNAKVRNVNFYGTRVEITSDKYCFAAPIAGVSQDSDISDCNIENAYVSMTSSAAMWGVGGIAGYGSGNLDRIKTDVKLICIDSDAEKRDEQFMGGAFGAGFMNTRDCVIKIDGYDSEHGYAHNGGITGMYMVYPAERDSSFSGEFLRDNVMGKITFYEDNKDRRAYCKAAFGEVLSVKYKLDGFESDFTRNEVYDYSQNLKPEMCESPVYTDVVTEPKENEFGYTTHTCNKCGYTYIDSYKIYGVNSSLTDEDAQNSDDISNENADADENSVKNSAMGIATIQLILLIAGVLVIAIVVLLAVMKRRASYKTKNKRY